MAFLDEPLDWTVNSRPAWVSMARRISLLLANIKDIFSPGDNLVEK
jgi:hypothetical protein